MDGSIAQLHSVYRIAGGQQAAQQLSARLDRVAREQLMETYAAALDQALADDPAVYVLRHVDVALVLVLRAGISDAELARRWGARMAGAVARKIARGAEDVVRFDSQAAFVAQFIADLLDGHAWERWFYHSFATHRQSALPDTLASVLRVNTDQLSLIVGQLHQANKLASVLRALDREKLYWLWAALRGQTSAVSADALRPLWAAALQIADRLALWQSARPADDALFQAYLAANPAPVDWRDRAALAIAVCDAVRFLLVRGYLRRPQPVVRLRDQRPRHPPVAPDSTVTAHERPLRQVLRTAVAALDWLDADWLAEALADLLAAPEAANLAPAPQRLLHGPTPRQHALLDDLLAVLADPHLHLDRSAPEAAANAVQLYAGLVARAPSWADDPLAAALIARLLRAWHLITQSERSADLLRLLSQRNLASALRLVREADQPDARASLQPLVDLGQPALTLIAALAGVPSEIHSARMQQSVANAHDTSWLPGSAPEQSVETNCAGVALLLRAVLDARLPGLLASAGYPAGVASAERLSTVLLALGLRWGGAQALHDGRLDAGLQMLAGYNLAQDAPATHDDLRARWAADSAQHDAFQRALLRTLLGQRLVDRSALHLYRQPLHDGSEALIAADDSTALWPLGHILHAPDDAAQIVTEWRAAWAEITGHTPALIADDALGIDPTVGVAQRVTPAGRERLASALAALEHGQLGLPDADLTVALTAIALLRLWARWLRQFADSSVPYLLKNFVRRAGRIIDRPDGLLVELEPLPLDIVVEMAGYTAALERVPWLDGRQLRFSLRA